MLTKGLILQRIDKVDAVCIGQLTTLQAIHHIHGIVFLVAFRIGLLDTTARGGVVMSDGEADHRTIGQIDRTLDEAFTKGSATHNDTTILILDGTCDNLCCRSCETIDQDNHLSIEEHTTTIGLILHTRHFQTLGIDNEIAPLQELVGDIDSGFQISTTILLKVEDKVNHTCLTQFIETLKEFLMGGSTKVTNADIANAWTDDIGSIHRLNRNLGTGNGKC